jgi:hypothetical protein
MWISEADTIHRWFSGAYLRRSSGHILLSLLPISGWSNRSLISWLLFCAVRFLCFFAYVLMTSVNLTYMNLICVPIPISRRFILSYMELSSLYAFVSQVVTYSHDSRLHLCMYFLFLPHFTLCSVRLIVLSLMTLMTFITLMAESTNTRLVLKQFSQAALCLFSV